MPGSIICGVRIAACDLSAVTVVTMSAPATASATLVARRSFNRGQAARWRTSLSVAASSMSNTASSVMPSSVWKASAWNSLCAPLPINAMRRAWGRARARAAINEVAQVRSAVAMVNSDNSSG